MISLSEQAFVDCTWGQGNNGCDGGESERAYEWLLLGKCLPTDFSYGPYKMQVQLMEWCEGFDCNLN